MEINGDTKLKDLLERYPFLVEFLPKLSPAFGALGDPEMRERMGDVATLEMVSSMGGMELQNLLEAVGKEVEARTGDHLEYGPGKTDRSKLEDLKGIILDLHDGMSVGEVKQRFLDLASEVDSTEIARMEEELIGQGIPEEEIKRLCDVHVEVFRESLDRK